MQTVNKQFGDVEMEVPTTWVDNSVVSFIGAPHSGFRPNILVTSRPCLSGSLASYVKDQRRSVEIGGFEDLEVVVDEALELDSRQFR